MNERTDFRELYTTIPPLKPPPPSDGVSTLSWWGGLERLNDSAGHAGGSLATGRVSQAGRAAEERPDYERCPGPPGWGFMCRVSSPHL